jgi:hypothetical protein
MTRGTAMSEHAADDLTARVERLEQQNRRLRFGGLAALAVVVGLILIGWAAGQRVSREIRAQEFMVVDKAGVPRALLGVHNGEPGLVLFDAARRARAAFNIGPEGASLILIDAHGPRRVSLIAKKDGPELAFLDQGETPRAVLVAGGKGPTLRLFDIHGFSATLGVAELDVPGLPSFPLKELRSAASLVMRDRENNVLWKAP